MKCVGALAQDEKMRLNTTKTKKMGVIFNTQNSQSLTWSLSTGELFQLHSGKFSSCRFSFSVARNAITKATEYITFGLSFR